MKIKSFLKRTVKALLPYGILKIYKHFKRQQLSNGSKVVNLQNILGKKSFQEQSKLSNDFLARNNMVACRTMYALDKEKYGYIFKNEYIRASSLALISKEIYDKNIAGSVAELGVFRGDFAKLINEVFFDRRLFLFDTFEGFDLKELEMEIKNGYLKGKEDNFSDTNVELVLNKMKYKENCIVKKGLFPTSVINEDINDRFAFVSLDADLFEPIYAGLHYFYEKLSKGGYIMVHDYTINRYTGVKTAVRKFSEEKGVGYVPICDSAGSVIITKMEG